MQATQTRLPIRLDAFDDAPLVTDPFEFVFVPEFIAPDSFPAIYDDFPIVEKGGSFPLDHLSYGAAFAALVEALESAALRHAVERKFNLDLTGRPTMLTVRGMGRDRDGGIHTDSHTKILTLLVYCNKDWTDPGGRLRLLRGAHDLADYALEVPPVGGNMILFKRSDRSFHGHLPTASPRRSLQLNWMVDQASRDSELSRHRRTAWFKRFNPFA